jgi:hypothetical protein
LLKKKDPFLIFSTSRLGTYGFKKAQEKAAKKGIKDVSKIGEWIHVYKTEIIKDDNNPTFRPFNISLNTLCNGSIDQPFLIECYDWNHSGNHTLIGTAQATVRDLQVLKEVKLINKKKIGFSKSAGLLQVLKCGPAEPNAVATTSATKKL